MHNPFKAGENRVLRPAATALVIFGATGDLTHRKLLPALYNLLADGYLPRNFIVVAVSRTKLTDEEFRNRVKESLEKYSRTTLSKEVWEQFSKILFYQPLDAGNVKDFEALSERLKELCSNSNELFNYLYYLATSPNLFGNITVNLKNVGLVNEVEADDRTTRIVVEKPFGHSLDSARMLNRVIGQNFDERQIFRIDHYLGKETVQNILVFRFGNGIFEPLWNHNFIDHIQITVSESVGVESRAGYFDQSGILRDIVQNHLLQMLSLLCIEPPISLSDADSIRDEKVKVLRSIKRIEYADVADNAIRGQYVAGAIEGMPVKGYTEEEGIADRSERETFAALKFEIDSWRWSGVPIYVRVGKRLPKRITEITIFFKRPPGSLFDGRQVNSFDHNVLAIQVQPEEGISLKINSKPPGPRMRMRPVEMDFTYDSSFGIASTDAYERLLLDAMKGDATLFTRSDEIEEAWDLLMPILERWESDRNIPLHFYKAGSWGPAGASELLKAEGKVWRRL